MSDPKFKDRPLSDAVTAEQRRQLVRVMEECAELTIAAWKFAAATGGTNSPAPKSGTW